MVTTKMVILMSAMIDKMGIDIENIEGKNNDEVGQKLMMLLVKNLYKAEDEVYSLIAEFKGVSMEEAKKADFIAVAKDILKDSGAVKFFT